ICANEDVGLADSEALPLAIATQQAVECVGMPEARIPLTHVVAYMCRAKKSREAYDALNAATEKIEMEQTKRVPEHLKNKHFPVNPGSYSATFILLRTFLALVARVERFTEPPRRVGVTRLTNPSTSD